MTREDVMSTPIFDELIREMAQRAEPQATPAEPQGHAAPAEQARPNPRRRHRAE
ncbi:MAG TPA: hypothetical protein VGP26_04915 [Actinophytocola sp.]|jgi:hypothetical protein|nr:hypothetical protein [Actinophytocola sp.]